MLFTNFDKSLPAGRELKRAKRLPFRFESFKLKVLIEKLIMLLSHRNRWRGTVADADGRVSSGLFPANYVEELN